MRDASTAAGPREATAAGDVSVTDAPLETLRRPASHTAAIDALVREIRTPMRGVIGMTDLLLTSSLTDHQRQLVATIQRSSLAVLTLLDDSRVQPSIATRRTDIASQTESDSTTSDAGPVAARISSQAARTPDAGPQSAATLAAWLAPPATTAPGEAKPQQRFAARILVAEDNPVNQEVTRELSLDLGCRVTCVENGAEAVQAFEAGAFDMVLMDCQMPVMDGLRATRAIRAIEQQRNAPRIPIVAVTANAFAEDRDACLDAGMDGYLSKPFNSAQLDGILQRWLPAHLVVERRGQPQRQTERTDVDLPDIDPIVLEPMKRQRADFYRRLIKTFLQHSPRLVEGLAHAAAQEDHAAIKIAAHSLKSSSANVGASRLSAIARDLETSAMHLDAVTAGARVRELSEVFARVKAHFEAELSRTTASEIAKSA